MVSHQLKSDEALFCYDEIDLQLKKILTDPVFAESEILKKFLSFIVSETIAGNSNCLKEYTIAVKVLGKPVSFKPQENGIVRIHAGRLRRALANYYSTVGVLDPIMISIPKWKYIPLFSDRNNAEIPADDAADPAIKSSTHSELHTVIAVLPFAKAESSPLSKSFSESLCMQLSTCLLEIDDVSVIAHQAIKSMNTTNFDFNEISQKMGCSHVVTGSIQSFRDKVRINIQIIQASNCEQIWGALFESTLTAKTVFMVQDEISQAVVSKFEFYLRNTQARESMVTVKTAV